jgi:phosphohistidine phosphatase
MKELILMRHGKSSWKNILLDDFDRSLKKRGKKDARFMAEFLASKEILPDLILASSALRTQQTTELINETFELDKSHVRFFESFYLADQKELMKTLNELDNNFGVVMIIGHNPTMEYFTTSLTNQSVTFPTAAVAHIKLEISNWSELRITTPYGKLLNLWYPKDLLKIEGK